MAKPNITAQYLREILNYDPETGMFTWRIVRRQSRFKQGDKAGGINGKGYINIKIDGRSYRANRLAWLYMTGKWPADQIDHMNGIRIDDRFCNLRECTNTENSQNTGMRKNNTSGFPGVNWNVHVRKWLARINLNGKSIHLGYFDDLAEAGAAYVKAKETFHIHSPAFKPKL